MVVFAAV